MTEQEYREIQARLTRKVSFAPPGITGKRREGYQEGLLAAKSIISELFHREHPDK